MELFDIIIGHRTQKDLLVNLIDTERIPHLLLFSGPASTGKYMMAMEMAKAILCRDDKYYCGHCEICRQHFDIHTIERDGNMIKIDQLRQFQVLAQSNPYKADRSIFIIRDAEYMNEEAMNSSLRTFEEPNLDVIIILIVSNINKLLPTIISRCFIIDFFALSKNEISQILTEKQGFNRKEAEDYLNISENSLEFLECYKSPYFKQLYDKGKYSLYEKLLKNCNIISISKILETIYKKDIILFLRLFVNYLEKNSGILINGFKDRYTLILNHIISSLDIYESYNLNEGIFLESFLLRLKEVLEENHD